MMIPSQQRKNSQTYQYTWIAKKCKRKMLGPSKLICSESAEYQTDTRRKGNTAKASYTATLYQEEVLNCPLCKIQTHHSASSHVLFTSGRRPEIECSVKHKKTARWKEITLIIAVRHTQGAVAWVEI